MFHDTNKQIQKQKGGLTVGDPVLRSGKPLSVELGPGKYISILTRILFRSHLFF